MNREPNDCHGDEAEISAAFRAKQQGRNEEALQDWTAEESPMTMTDAELCDMQRIHQEELEMSRVKLQFGFDMLERYGFKRAV